MWLPFQMNQAFPLTESTVNIGISFKTSYFRWCDDFNQNKTIPDNQCSSLLAGQGGALDSLDGVLVREAKGIR